jgi:hypothetical protein
MKRLLVGILSLLLVACASEPETMQLPPPEGLPQEQMPPVPVQPTQEQQPGLNISDLQSRLGLVQDSQDLGFNERSFDGCQIGVRGDHAPCGRRFLSVVHFRLLCRDSVETVQSVSANLTPLTSDSIQWRLGGTQGHTSTDGQGLGQVATVTAQTTKAQRFMLILGTHSLGVEASEVSQIVVPGNWCSP